MTTKQAAELCGAHRISMAKKKQDGLGFARVLYHAGCREQAEYVY